MATKEMERKALEQIKKIVSELGEDSYIGMAFEGCFEIARTNIDNDWACSMKQKAESAESELKTLRQKAADEANHAKAVREHLEKKLADAEQTSRIHTEWIERYNGEIRELKKAADAREEAARKMQEVIDRQEAEKEQMAMEILKLKARLFDLMEK